MPGMTRKTLDTAGDQLIEGSPDVFCNGVSVVRIGDAVKGHGPGAHGGPKMAEGSASVFCNGIPVCFAGNLATCNDPSTGSSDVFVGG